MERQAWFGISRLGGARWELPGQARSGRHGVLGEDGTGLGGVLRSGRHGLAVRVWLGRAGYVVSWPGSESGRGLILSRFLSGLYPLG